MNKIMYISAQLIINNIFPILFIISCAGWIFCISDIYTDRFSVLQNFILITSTSILLVKRSIHLASNIRPNSSLLLYKLVNIYKQNEETYKVYDQNHHRKIDKNIDSLINIITQLLQQHIKSYCL